MTMISWAARQQKQFDAHFSHGVHCAPCVYINYKWIHIFYHIICSSVTIQMTLTNCQRFSFCFSHSVSYFSPFVSYFLHRIPIIIIIIYFVTLGDGGTGDFSVFFTQHFRLQIHKTNLWKSLPFAMHVWCMNIVLCHTLVETQATGNGITIEITNNRQSVFKTFFSV